LSAKALFVLIWFYPIFAAKAFASKRGNCQTIRQGKSSIFQDICHIVNEIPEIVYLHISISPLPAIAFSKAASRQCFGAL